MVDSKRRDRRDRRCQQRSGSERDRIAFRRVPLVGDLKDIHVLARASGVRLRWTEKVSVVDIENTLLLPR